VRKKDQEYFAPGTAPERKVQLAGSGALMMEISTGLADSLEDDMSDSDDDEGDGLHVESPSERRRLSSSLSFDSQPSFHLHKVNRKRLDSVRDFGLHSQHMEKYQHQLDDANLEQDLDLKKGTHSEVVKNELLNKKGKEKQRPSVSIQTEADEIKRR